MKYITLFGRKIFGWETWEDSLEKEFHKDVDFIVDLLGQNAEHTTIKKLLDAAYIKYGKRKELIRLAVLNDRYSVGIKTIEHLDKLKS